MAEPKNVVTPEANLIKSEDLKKVREVDFTLMFGESVKTLMQALGVTRLVKKPVGADISAYVATGSLSTEEVAEGEIIPLSHYETTPVTLGKVRLDKFRKATSVEAINEKGYAQAVTMTTAKMIKDVQKKIKSRLFTAFGTTSVTTSGVGLQGALAQAWGVLQNKFEDDDIEAVYFVNPADIADYLGTAQISTQNAFGMKYVEDFLGLGTVIISSSVTPKHVWATAKENMIGYYADVNDSDIGEVFSFTTDETGLIGIHEAPNYDNMTASDTVVSGITFFPERIDGVVDSSITGGVVDSETASVG